MHGDIDLIPARTASRWTMQDGNDTALIVALPTALVDDVAVHQELDPRRLELRIRFQMRDPQLETSRGRAPKPPNRRAASADTG
ncbi:hypothetical protein [Tunturiibacter gelidoferens]|uniref:hypothetical protein n=1 Tax=Tunturiibacter gelidiferens TaxID=3069689 RepID=UPI00161E4647|nr:hypothetical protein [Edaphobacter lichenicola]